MVILDVMLPERDGFEVALELRRRGSTIPILMLSARAEEVDAFREHLEPRRLRVAALAREVVGGFDAELAARGLEARVVPPAGATSRSRPTPPGSPRFCAISSPARPAMPFPGPPSRCRPQVVHGGSS